MKSFITRGFLLSFLFLLIAGGILFLLLGFPQEDTWMPLIKEVRYGMPPAVWILAVAVALGWCLSAWSTLLVRSVGKTVERRLALLTGGRDAQTGEAAPLPNQTERVLADVERLLGTQRERLKQISDERAETQEELVQERLVQERQRLARELHDSVSQQLFAASMLLSAMAEKERQEKGSPSKVLEQVEKTVQQAQVEMRALLLHLRPAALNDKTLADGLRELLRELDEKVHFAIRGRIEDVPLSKGAEDHLFRIAQETLSNALRHAKATELDVLFVERDGIAIFRVQDNGVGFREGDGRAGSYGLRNVRERAVEIGGTCKVVSVPSQGTIIEVKVPASPHLEEDGAESGETERPSGGVEGTALLNLEREETEGSR
ncbi:sensor histidine kinase [Edaphobacillus lindanitolerans]|uniref:histidine kinase n=1 Tax=Edaphobacillus lindanitolerans TaxID=550447 RepID=A0A1U7PIN8_9BACI|nr:sensor histidine kinase [Edaphobacillus lindanitolerans]SIT74984.1 two-component system, NarL family, vancomycin resistance sensor histidine kinase VraS/two-component system, NarL family, sensor histidine kinase LiaS [Edaphobacillus lindanitolerans]